MKVAIANENAILVIEETLEDAVAELNRVAGGDYVFSEQDVELRPEDVTHPGGVYCAPISDRLAEEVHNGTDLSRQWLINDGGVLDMVSEPTDD
jgi:hypothetical protein